MENSEVIKSADSLFARLNNRGPMKRKNEKCTVGERVEIAKYAIEHGGEAAMQKFGVGKNSISRWVLDFNKGIYDNVPPDFRQVKKGTRQAIEQEQLHMEEVLSLRAENKILAEQNQKLISVIERMVRH